MHDELDLASLRAFHSVVTEGSFAAGARRLDAPPSTVSKRVRDLERQLGVRLIERTTRQMRVTAEGEALVHRAGRLLADAEEVRRALGDARGMPRGHLRIATPELVGQILMGRIAALSRRRYPDITLEFVFSDAPPHLLQERFDAVIRFGPLEDSSHVARVLSTGAPGLVAAPDLPGLDAITEPKDVGRLPIIHVSAPWSHAWRFRRGNEAQTVRYEPALSFPSLLAARDAAIAGAGVTMLPVFLSRPEIAAGRLVPLLPDWAGPQTTLHLVYASASAVTARLRAFIDLLVAELDETLCLPDRNDSGGYG